MNAGRLGDRSRNVVLNHDVERAVQRHAIAVEVGRLERRRDVQRQRLLIATAISERQMIDLVLQRERERAIAVVHDREHGVGARRCRQRVAHDRIGHREIVRGQAGRIANQAVQAERHVLIRTGRHQRLELRRGDRQRHIRVAGLRVAGRLRVRKPVLIDRAERNRSLQRDGNVVEHLNRERTGAQRDAVAVTVGCGDESRKIDAVTREQIFVVVGVVVLAVEFRMIDLIQQREGIGAVRSDRQCKDKAIGAGLIARAAVIRVTAQNRAVGDNQDILALRLEFRKRRRRHSLQSKAAEAIGSKVDEIAQVAGDTVEHIRVRAANFAIPARVGIRTRQTVLIDDRDLNLAAQKYRAVILDVDRRCLTVSQHNCGKRYRRIIILVDDRRGQRDAEACALLRQRQRQRRIEIVSVSAMVDWQILIDDELRGGGIVAAHQRDAQRDGAGRVVANAADDYGVAELEQVNRIAGDAQTSQSSVGQRRGDTQTTDTTNTTRECQTEQLCQRLLAVGAGTPCHVEQKRKVAAALSHRGLDLADRICAGRVRRGIRWNGVLRKIVILRVIVVRSAAVDADRLIQRRQGQTCRLVIASAGRDPNRRGVVVNAQIDGAVHEVAVAVGDAIIEDESLIVLVAAILVPNRIQLLDREIARHGISQGNDQHIDVVAVLNLTDRQR